MTRLLRRASSTAQFLVCCCALVGASTGCSSAEVVGGIGVDQASPGAGRAAADEARNVLLVTIDTLRADHLGVAGGPARTPVLDSLANGGWNFTRAYSASMLTNPSHASLMTSLHPRDHGVYDNSTGIQDGLRTLASALSQRGFATAAVIGFEHLEPPVSNLGVGFDVVVPATSPVRRANATTDAALDFLDTLGTTARFFLWVHYTDPHAPYDPPSAHPPRVGDVPAHRRSPMVAARRAAPGFQRNNPWFRKALRRHTNTAALAARYVAEVETADAGVGRLLDGMAKRGCRDSTAVVVTSDHGENMGEHGLFFHHGGLYESTVRVPLIIAGAGIERPRRLEGLVEAVDVAPTVLALAGVTPWDPMRGRNLGDYARGLAPARRYVFSEHMQRQLVSVRSETATVISHRSTSRQFPTYRFVKGHIELYDRRADPDETRTLPANLRHEPPFEPLLRALRSYDEAGLAMAPRRPRAINREALRALGYVQ